MTRLGDPDIDMHNWVIANSAWRGAEGQGISLSIRLRQGAKRVIDGRCDRRCLRLEWLWKGYGEDLKR